jgi:hypothetical protein
MKKYKVLISKLPVRQQCFTTQRSIWEKAESELAWLKELNNSLFGAHKSLTVSRDDVFNAPSLRELIVKTIYWGYARGMRGNNFVNILNKIEQIETVLTDLKSKDAPNSEDFNHLVLSFKSVKGLGLSTYSKLLYFSGLTFNNQGCLILDQRLIDVFHEGTYGEYKALKGIKYSNAEAHYLEYLTLTNSVSEEIKTGGENIEQFLFIFGDHLKK